MIDRFVQFLNPVWDFLGKALAFLLLWFSPIRDYIYLVIALILIDALTGIYASVKEGKKWEAKKMRRTVEKFIFYAIAIIVAFLLQRIADDGNEIPRIIALYIGATEVKSIYENIGRITRINFMNIILNILKSKIDDFLTKIKRPENENSN